MRIRASDNRTTAKRRRHSRSRLYIIWTSQLDPRRRSTTGRERCAACLTSIREKGESAVTHFDESARRAIDAKTKPLGALGRLEDIAVRLAVLQGTLAPRVDVARACVFAGDHGVTAEGVSAYPSAVTAEMMKNFVRGGAAINVI